MQILLFFFEKEKIMSKLPKWGLLNSFKMFLVMANEIDTLQQKNGLQEF
jgi:hypothetical protein